MASAFKVKLTQGDQDMRKQEDSADRGKCVSRCILIITIFFALAFFAGGVWLTCKDANETWRARVSESGNGSEWENPGIRGDFWGGHLAAVSGLIGAVLMFGALLLQSHELGLQRKDLKVQQTEFKKSREEAEKQTHALEGQLEHAKQRAESEKYDATLRLLMDIGARAFAVYEQHNKDPRPMLVVGFGRIIDQSYQAVSMAETVADPMAMVEAMLDFFLASAVGVPDDQISTAWQETVKQHSPILVADDLYGASGRSWMGDWIESTSERLKPKP